MPNVWGRSTSWLITQHLQPWVSIVFCDLAREVGRLSFISMSCSVHKLEKLEWVSCEQSQFSSSGISSSYLTNFAMLVPAASNLQEDVNRQLRMPYWLLPVLFLSDVVEGAHARTVLDSSNISLLHSNTIAVERIDCYPVTIEDCHWISLFLEDCYWISLF